MISRAQAISIMEGRDSRNVPLPFSIQFVSITTGELKDWTNLILAKNHNKLPKHIKGSGRPLSQRKDPPELLKIYHLDTGEIKSVHFQLITYINQLQIAP